MAKTSAPHRYREGWRIKWLDEAGKRKSSFHTSFLDAQEALIANKFEVEQIKKGYSKRYSEEKIFSELCDYWLINVAPTKRSYKDQLSIIQKRLRPFFGHLKLKDITNEYTQKYIISFSDGRSNKTVANHLIVLISMLNFASEMKWLREVPKIKKPKIPRNGNSFSYLKNDEEVSRFLTVAKTKGLNVYTLYAFAVFTGMRQGEIAGLHWSDVDLDTRRICVRFSFNGPTKSGEARYVPILDPLVPILFEWKKYSNKELVFTSIVGTMYSKSAWIFQETLKEVLKDAGFEKKTRSGRSKHYITFHDLRHTFASHWMMKGGDIYRLQNVLGHQSIEMTQRYSHLSPHIYKDDYARFNSIAI